MRNRSLIEKVSRIQITVAEKLIQTSVKLVRARGSHNAHLRSRPLAILRPIRVRDHIELAHSLHSQQLPAHPAGRQVDERSARVLNSIQQKQILLRPPA